MLGTMKNPLLLYLTAFLGPGSFARTIVQTGLTQISHPGGYDNISDDSNHNANDKNVRDVSKDTNWDNYYNLEPSDHPCSSLDFKYTAKNVDDSQATKHFEELVTMLRSEFPKDFERMGQTKLWALKEWGSETFDCDMKDGCTGRPSCQDIYNWKLEIFKGDKKQATDATRKVWLSLIKIIEINRFIRLNYDLLLEIQGNVIYKLADIIVNFTPQKDTHAEAVCAFKRAILSSVINGLVDAAGVAAGFLAGVASPAVQATEQAIRIALQVIRISKMAAENAIAVEAENAKNEINSGPREEGSPFYESMGNGDCWSPAYGSKEENFERLAQLSSWLSTKFQITREQSHVLWNAINDGTDIGAMTMVDWMNAGHLPMRSPQFKEFEATLPRLLTKRVEQAIVSTALAVSKCYVKCTTHEAGNLCPWKLDPNWKPEKGETNWKDFRVCFGEEGKPSEMACEAQCWNDKDDNHEVDLFGWKHLTDYGLTVSDLIENSRDIYFKYHNVARPGEVNSFRFGSSGDKVHAFLPTCISRTVVLNDKAFPISCGGPDSNDTIAFLDGIYMSPKGDIDEIEDPKFTHIVRAVIPKVVGNFPPLNGELLYCEIKKHYPPKDVKSRLVRGRQDHCNSLISQVASMDEAEANTWFCKSDIYEELAEHEAGYISIPRGWKTSEKAGAAFIPPAFAGVLAIPKTTEHPAPWVMCKYWLERPGYYPRKVMEDNLNHDKDQVNYEIRPKLDYLYYEGQPMLTPRRDYSKIFNEEQQTFARSFPGYIESVQNS